jgi:large subunit ribosomal protein L10
MPSLLNKIIYKETKKAFEDASSIVFMNYLHFDQKDAVDIRAASKNADASARVIKNSVAQLVLKDMGYGDVEALMQGPVIVVLGSDPVGAAKASAGFIKSNKKGEILGGIVDGAIVSDADVKALSKLPSREALLGQVAGLLAAPMTGLVTVLDANIKGCAVVLNAIKEKKEKEAA